MAASSSSPAPSSTPSPALAFSSPPFSTSYSSSDDVAQSLVINAKTPVSENSALQKLGADLGNLIGSEVDHSFSDVIIEVAGFCIPLHRCILAARCPFFKSLFSREKSFLASFAPAEQADTESTRLRLDLSKVLTTLTKVENVSYDAFKAVLTYLYSGHQTIEEISCIDDQCSHEDCRPVVNFAIEMLRLSSALEIIDLMIYWEHRLQNVLEKAQVDEILPILVTAKVHGVDSLLFSCQHLVANSNMDNIDIKKLLPETLSEEILLLRSKMGLLQPEAINPMREKQCQRIWKALDSHDVELVRLLLEESEVNLDGAYALHYAVAYCSSHLVRDILEQGLADVNSRNNRGFAVLHVACIRLDPSILGYLLYRGANHLETTPDGRTPSQICSRMVRKFTADSDVHGSNSRRELLCLELLFLAGKNKLFQVAAFPPAANQEELLNRLFYLENRVGLGRLFFPEEANLIMGITHLEATDEFVGLRDIINDSKKEPNMDLNQAPSDQVSRNTFKPLVLETLVKRVEALQTAVSMGRQMFPRCITILDSFTDDDPCDLASIKFGSSEEHKNKKRRYAELKSMIADAFQKDFAAMKNHSSHGQK